MSDTQQGYCPTTYQAVLAERQKMKILGGKTDFEVGVGGPWYFRKVKCFGLLLCIFENNFSIRIKYDWSHVKFWTLPPKMYDFQVHSLLNGCITLSWAMCVLLVASSVSILSLVQVISFIAFHNLLSWTSVKQKFCITCRYLHVMQNFCFTEVQLNKLWKAIKEMTWTRLRIETDEATRRTHIAQDRVIQPFKRLWTWKSYIFGGRVQNLTCDQSYFMRIEKLFSKMQSRSPKHLTFRKYQGPPTPTSKSVFPPRIFIFWRSAKTAWYVVGQ